MPPELKVVSETIILGVFHKQKGSLVNRAVGSDFKSKRNGANECAIRTPC